VLAVREPWRLAFRAPRLARLPRGDGHPVVLVPGLGATDLSMAPLRSFLRHLGHDARPAGLGRMTDDVPGNRRHLAELAQSLHDSTGMRPALVGWSIGGVSAREAARDHPDLIRRVITFGSPVVGGPGHSVVARRYPPEVLAAVAAVVAERNRTPIRVPITAMWSRRDGVVAPRACIDTISPDVENIEVTSTHLGMGLDPDVWAITAERLSR
jgi:pimeloyl-ACP methyl ester carboxylesterase